jgi:hypothetical protein
LISQLSIQEAKLGTISDEVSMLSEDEMIAFL